MSDLTLLFTASNMASACEASLIASSSMVSLLSLDELGRCNLNEWCVHCMVWVGIQEYDTNATVCNVNHHGLVLFEILEGAPLFRCDIMSQWLGLLNTGGNSTPEVLDSFCISCSDF